MKHSSEESQSHFDKIALVLALNFSLPKRGFLYQSVKIALGTGKID